MSFSTRWRAEPAFAAWIVLALLAAGLQPSLANTHEHAAQAVPAAPRSGPHPQLSGSRLLGEANLRYWGLRIYIARLWTLPSFRADQLAEHPLVLELEYQRDLKGGAIAERSLTEMRRAGPIPEPQAQRWLAQMQRIFPDVQAGDRLTGQHQPGQGATFWHNGRMVGRIDEPEFSGRFFGIWLAPTTSQPDLRTALLGLNPSPER